MAHVAALAAPGCWRHARSASTDFAACAAAHTLCGRQGSYSVVQSGTSGSLGLNQRSPKRGEERRWRSESAEMADGMRAARSAPARPLRALRGSTRRSPVCADIGARAPFAVAGAGDDDPLRAALVIHTSELVALEAKCDSYIAQVTADPSLLSLVARSLAIANEKVACKAALISQLEQQIAAGLRPSPPPGGPQVPQVRASCLRTPLLRRASPSRPSRPRARLRRPARTLCRHLAHPRCPSPSDPRHMPAPSRAPTLPAPSCAPAMRALLSPSRLRRHLLGRDRQRLLLPLDRLPLLPPVRLSSRHPTAPSSRTIGRPLALGASAAARSSPPSRAPLSA
jgi:hypothetical protein